MVGVLVLLAGGVLLAPTLGTFLVVADPLPHAADAIVILAGSPRDRALEAAALYRKRLAPIVVVTREGLVSGDLELRAAGVDLPESDAITRLALQGLGVPPRAILTLRRRTSSTVSEARTIARWACAHGIHRVVVVTSPAHTRRARLSLARALGPHVVLTIHPTTANTFAASRWYRVRRDAKIVASEWQKLSNYWIRERWTIEACGGLRLRAPR
jgi:uncharacterized SAM-binding protein YcdF (DUF218 family)